MEPVKSDSRGNSFAYHFFHIYRNRVMNILFLVILAVFFVAHVLYYFPREILQCYELLSENVKQAATYQDYVNDANDLYTSMQDQSYLIQLQLDAEYIDEGMNPADCIDLLKQAGTDNDSLFYVKKNGTVISPEDSAPLTLTSEQFSQLIEQGRLQNEEDSKVYYALACGQDWLIDRIDNVQENLFTCEPLNYIYLDGFVYWGDTLDITDCDNDDFPSNFGEMYRSEPLKSASFTNPNVQIVLISPSNHGITKFTGMKLAILSPLSYEWEGKYLCAYIPVTEIVFTVLVKSGLPAMLCLAFIFLTIYGSMHFRKQGRKNEKGKKIGLPFHCYINLTSARHILFMQIFLGLLVIICSVTILLLNIFTDSHEIAQYRMKKLANTIESCDSIQSECWVSYTDPADTVADVINETLMKGNFENNTKAQKLISNLVENTFVKEVSIYDQNGNNVFTTANHIGYPLSNNPDSEQYQFWELMSGNTDSLMVPSDSDPSIYYYAVRRSDEIGIILITFHADGYVRLKNELSSQSVITRLNYYDSYYFVQQQNPETFYQITKYGDTITYANEDLPVVTNGQTFCGFRDVNQTLCLIDGYGTETQSIYYASSVSDVLNSVRFSVTSLLIFFALTCVLELLGSVVYSTESERFKKQSHSEQHPLMLRMAKRVELTDDILASQATIWRQCVYCTLVLIVVMLLLDLLLNGNYMLEFMLGGNFEKKISIFSLSMIAVSCLAVFVLFRILGLFFSELIRSLPPKSATACQMARSIIRIALIVLLLLFSANQVGINTTAIVASLGLTVLALSMAAKDILNDMMNGMFIILDGRIQIGDFVQVGDYYGVVKQIGIRSTTLSYLNTEKCINNSAMNNVVNLSRGSSSVYITFTVPFDTDLKFLAELIETSTPRFQEYCEGKLKGDIKFLDVPEFCSYGITCALCVGADECNRKSLTRKCNRILKEILDENGIILAHETVVNYVFDSDSSLDHLKEHAPKTERKDENA